MCGLDIVRQCGWVASKEGELRRSTLHLTTPLPPLGSSRHFITSGESAAAESYRKALYPKASIKRSSETF